MRTSATLLATTAACLFLAAPSLSTAQIVQIWEMEGGVIRTAIPGQWGTFPSLDDPPPAEFNRVGTLVRHGEVFALPPYPSDGQPAAESEIFWIVRPSTGYPGTCADPGTGEVRIDFEGRELVMDPPTCPDGAPNSVWVDIFALRAQAPTGTEPTSFGRVKSAYR